MPVKDGNAATQEIRQLQDDGKAGYSHILGVSANVREAQTDSMRAAGMDDIISKPFKVDDLVKRIRSIVLEEKPAKKEANEDSSPAEKMGSNKEVRNLENVPIRSRSGQDRFEVSEAGRRNEEGGSRDSSGHASVELGGKLQPRRQTSKDQDSTERAKDEAGGGRVEKAQSDKNEVQEDRDRRAGHAGRPSGREGEARGGERSRSVQRREK